MRSPKLTNALARFRSLLVDPARAEHAVLWSLGVYLIAWTLYGTIAKSSQGLHYDMTEVIAWSSDLDFGYLKHPPLAAWLVRGWFTVFPVTEASYYLLAMLMPTLALWIAWRLSADYLDLEKRVAGLALLMLVPFFNFHALKFNVNTVLMPLWAMTTLWFLRSYTTRSLSYAALAGFGAALCMLGKYWSVFLLAGLVVAALFDRRRVAYFKSPAPWITVIVGLVVLSPHLVWLKQHDFAPFTYAMGIHGDKPFVGTVVAALGYLGGSVAYIAVPLIAVAIIILRSSPRKRGPSASMVDVVWPADTERRLAALAFWGPFLLPVVGALLSGTEITSLWSMPAFTLLPVLLLSSPDVTLREVDTRRILGLAVVVPLIALIASPVIAIMAQRAGPAPAAAHAELLAMQIAREWNRVTPLPLRYVGGNEEIAYDVAAYEQDRPHALPNLPAPDANDLRHSGEVLVCFAEEAACRQAAEKSPGARTIESTIQRNFWRFPGKPQGYTIVVVPPR
jgi:4-amino-4-deoxy-L-arabinose transferase-like glycosyltransferase